MLLLFSHVHLDFTKLIVLLRSGVPRFQLSVVHSAKPIVLQSTVLD